MKKQFITTLIIFISLTLNAQSWWGGKKVKGNGKIITKTRSISKFDKVSVGGSFDVNLVAGTEGKITLKGEENLLPYIETTVKNGKLKVQFKENTNIRTTKRLIVTIAFESIDAVSLGGSGDVSVQKVIKSDEVSISIGGSGSITANIDVNTLKASIGGSGNIKLKGTTNNLKCSIAGSGNIKAYDLDTETLKASIAGSGNIQTTVNNKIKATVAGSGSVHYKGNPTNISTNSIGSGDVIDKN
ncbi:head GIN domain-containing protein [Tenacibaculum ovolyticum]|uniref:head GIN domain-containing protein n=1 Tax=Tenacibaculum ovolyticum TaxID=104270 RepID=UPI00040305D9|nr:head GIN domain-containing protein [Tenacibaculum ovolyticum]